MCGIAGFVSKQFSKDDLVKMTSAIQHRGPDAKGHYFNSEKNIGLGHRRLSIIDLSDAANQPMESHCSRYRMVYNGEVYNYKEIAKKLGALNWKTSSDTEVILESFVKWGTDFVYELNGMFAIAIYDLLEEKLFLFRDRMGIKPLYYYYNGKDVIFASELKAINQLEIKKKINHSSIYSYLHLGYIPLNQTIYNNVFKVNPGSYLIYNNNELREKYYWKPENKFEENSIKDFNSSKKQLRSLLQDSIKTRLMSDVPIGTFLSGGTDSSIITAIAQEVNNSPINTFSIGFKEAKYNESEHANKVAKHVGTNHHEFILTEDDALNELENIMDHFDEPFADSSALPTMLISKMAKKHVTVCLSGDGGDELFMGYGAYQWANRVNHPLFRRLRYPISKLLEFSADNQKKRAALVFNSPNNNWKSHIFSQEQYLFSESEINKLLLDPDKNSIINNLNADFKLKRKLSPSEKQAFFDLNNYLIDDLLVKVDRSSMYSSLEARVPLLDHKIVEFALNLEKGLKINNGVQKYILKELLYDYVPKKIMDRPKWGFSIPLEKWLQNELHFLIEKYLNRQIIDEFGILDSKQVQNLINRFNRGQTYLYNRIWCLILLQKFLVH